MEMIIIWTYLGGTMVEKQKFIQENQLVKYIETTMEENNCIDSWVKNLNILQCFNKPDL